MACPAGRVNTRDQPLIAVLLVLAIVMLAVRPVFQVLVAYVTRHAPAPPPPADVVKVTRAELPDRLPAPSRARTYTWYCVPGVSPVSVIELPADWPSSGSVAPCSR